MPKPTQYMFKIAFGDFSNDGHGQTDTRVFKSRKPIEAVREAYFAGTSKAPAPHTLCSEYEEDHLQPAALKKLKALRAPLYKGERADVDWIAKYTAWYLNLSDPELEIEEVPERQLPFLHFYGQDEKGRHINFIGYGLFGN